MKYKRTIPEGEETPKFRITSEGEHKFQIVDIFSESEEKIVIKCESLSEATSILYSVNISPDSKFYWLAKIFLKAIGEPYQGEIMIDTDAWIGRQFKGKVVHTTKGDKTYANIREVSPTGEAQPAKNVNPNEVKTPEEIVWEN